MNTITGDFETIFDVMFPIQQADDHVRAWYQHTTLKANLAVFNRRQASVAELTKTMVDEGRRLRALELGDARGRLSTVEKVVEFAQAGNATLTLVSRKSGERFTYKIQESDNGWLFFVSVLTGSDNETDYKYLGCLRNGQYKHGGHKAKVGADAQSAKAFGWFWGQIHANNLPDTVEVWHEGRCGRCGRKLTVPASVERGIGPECATRM